MSASTHAKYEVYSRRSKEIGHVKDADKETDSAKINAHYRFIGQRGSGTKRKIRYTVTEEPLKRRTVLDSEGDLTSASEKS